MAAGCLAALAGITAIPVMAQMQDNMAVGSIHPAGKVKRADLAEQIRAKIGREYVVPL